MCHFLEKKKKFIVGSPFPNQDLNQGHSHESPEFQSLDH